MSKVYYEELGSYLGKDRGGKGRGISFSFVWGEGFREGFGYLSVGFGDMEIFFEGFWVCCL